MTGGKAGSFATQRQNVALWQRNSWHASWTVINIPITVIGGGSYGIRRHTWGKAWGNLGETRVCAGFQAFWVLSSKLAMRVRFPSPAPRRRGDSGRQVMDAA
jgi:hypothetical protein